MKKSPYIFFVSILVLVSAIFFIQCSGDNETDPRTWIEHGELDENWWIQTPDTFVAIRFIDESNLCWSSGRGRIEYSYTLENDTLYLYGNKNNEDRKYKIKFESEDRFRLWYRYVYGEIIQPTDYGDRFKRFGSD